MRLMFKQLKVPQRHFWISGLIITHFHHHVSKCSKIMNILNILYKSVKPVNKLSWGSVRKQRRSLPLWRINDASDYSALAGETVLQIFKEDNEDDVTSAVWFFLGQTTATEHTDSAETHRQLWHLLASWVAKKKSLTACQRCPGCFLTPKLYGGRGGAEPLVKNTSHYLFFFFFRGLSSFLGRHQKKSCCVWGKVQRNAKRSNKTNNGVEK